MFTTKENVFLTRVIAALAFGSSNKPHTRQKKKFSPGKQHTIQLLKKIKVVKLWSTIILKLV